MAKSNNPMRNRAREILKTKKPETDEAHLQKDRTKAASARKLREARAVIRALEKELDEAQQRTELVFRLDEAPPAKPYKRSRRKKKSSRDATYVMLASDWHVGERVRPENASYRNEYTPDIAAERAEQFFKSSLVMLNAARSAWDIDHGVFWLGGDLITGYIHEEYEESNFLSPSQEALLCFELLNKGLRHMLDASDLAHILVPTNHGNHGRTTKKKRAATSAYNSFEWMLYKFMAEYWKDEPRLEFKISDGYHNLVDVYDDFRIRFHHGDEIGYGGGVGGLSIPVNRRIGRQAKNDPERVDLDVLGHFHALQYPRDFIVNGSMIGWCAYAENKGFPFEAPLQASFVVDQKHGLVNNFNPILVEPRSA